METGKIAERFDQTAREYDARRGCFIPHFEVYYGSMVEFIARCFPAPRSILDLGAGTGLLSRYLLKHYPRAEFTLVDVSAGMLDLARDRFRGLPNFCFMDFDYSKGLPEGEFDMIASALSIHHLRDQEKLRLYGRIYAGLPDGGVFLNLDQFNSTSAEIEAMFQKRWNEYIKASGLPKAEYAKWLERRSLDKENTVEETQAMLREAGFSMVECIYRFMKFGAIIAIKG